MNELWAITSYFNPSNYHTKAQNYRLFAEGIARIGVPLLTIECAFGDQPFTLAATRTICQVRTRDVLWLKERLLNLAVKRLPVECTKVAWLDSDLIFENSEWPRRTLEVLDDVPVVQPFSQVVRLPPGHREYDGEGEQWESFCAQSSRNPALVRAGNFHYHGHTGFAWAVRREILERHGLYDTCMTGSGDHLMAHAFCGDWESGCIAKMLGSHGPYRDHFTSWARAVFEEVQGKIAFVEGRLLHLWHGDLETRRYHENNLAFRRFEFDPRRDLRLAPNGCWEWQPDRQELRQWAKDFFPARCEDGVAVPTVSTPTA
jgi:hypothetical protein